MLEAWNHIRSRRNDAIDAKDMAIWLGHVENGHDVGTVPANINNRTAYQIRLRVVSTVVDRIRWEAKDVELAVLMTQSPQKQVPTDKMLPPGVINIGHKCETGLAMRLRERRKVRVN
ncbi:uncharacterized protein A1O9_13051 [Exophiala aquamarina CBS 119918]|uniref:Uncharacterized protein n=1 Tax=Exophiala aquamarina CBS 119918 TaxID=1182545 RepID=A0A072NU62_9EURO|nr:uncharacterized protein A1O9_13051 [Exophiala aquamarina CBS 119918]KEF50902.1 hypothetical protein A1O9_13051 [Exophiala aquamarina CBS 119918]